MQFINSSTAAMLRYSKKWANDSTIYTPTQDKYRSASYDASYPKIVKSESGCVRPKHGSCEMCCNDVCCEDLMKLPAQSPLFKSFEQLWVPVRFIVLLKSFETDWVKDDKLLHQLRVANKEYKRMNIPFRLLFHSKHIHTNTLWVKACQDLDCQGDSCVFQNEVLAKFVTNPREIVIVFICEGASAAGVAVVPWTTTEYSKYNYVLISDNAVKYDWSSSQEWIDALPKTLIHEMGHYFGLLHTFDPPGTCEGPGDYVNDTPQTLNPGTKDESCSFSKDSCPSMPGYDMKNNYMDYYSRVCRTAFTKGQIDRMKHAINVFRPLFKANLLISSYGAECKDDATHFGHCNCGGDSLCAPELFCRASNNPICNSTSALTTHRLQCTCPRTFEIAKKEGNLKGTVNSSDSKVFSFIGLFYVDGHFKQLPCIVAAFITILTTLISIFIYYHYKDKRDNAAIQSALEKLNNYTFTNNSKLLNKKSYPMRSMINKSDGMGLQDMHPVNSSATPHMRNMRNIIDF